MIRLQNITFLAAGSPSVTDVSLTAAPGEVTVLLGPANSGKSLLCDISCGVTSPQEGKVYIDDIDMEADPIAAKKCIGYMPESVSLFRDATPRTHMRFVGQTREFTSRELSEHVEKVLKQMKLLEVATVPIRNLPHIYLQRVALAQAIMADTRNIVLDAPTRGLDARQVAEFRLLLAEAARGRSVLLSTDNVTEAEQLGATVYILHEGRVLSRCSVGELSYQQADTEVTAVTVAGDQVALEQALAAANLPLHAPVTQRDALSTALVKTGLAIEGRTNLSLTLHKAGLPIVEMRPVRKSLDDLLLKLSSDSYTQEAQREDEPQ